MFKELLQYTMKGDPNVSTSNDGEFTAGQIARVLLLPENTVQAWIRRDIKRGAIPREAFSPMANQSGMRRFCHHDLIPFLFIAVLTNWGLGLSTVGLNLVNLTASLAIRLFPESLSANQSFADFVVLRGPGANQFESGVYSVPIGSYLNTVVRGSDAAILVVDLNFIDRLFVGALNRAQEMYGKGSKPMA